MKILVLSDSHRYMQNMVQAIEEEKPDHVIHLGDHIRDAEELSMDYPMLPVLKVRGNCDYDVMAQEEVLTEFRGFRFLICHGHRYGVKSGLLRYTLAAKEKLADVALFGHTHQRYCEEYEGTWLLNPGSCGYGSRASYGLIEISQNQITCQIKYANK